MIRTGASRTLLLGLGPCRSAPSVHRWARPLTYSYSKRVACEPKQIYDIVLDVKEYKHFVPYVIDSGHEYQYKQEGVSEGEGTGYFTLEFQTYNELVDCKLEFTPDIIISRCHTGQLKHLECKWSFEEVVNRFTKKKECNVKIDLDYEFNSFVYNQLSQWFTSEISRIMVKSFEKRLKQLRSKNIGHE